jgi:orotate phosphoribosyltransferase
MVNESASDERRAAGEEAGRILIEIGAVNFRPSEPYILTAGWASPVYIDCRKLISYLEERRRVIQLGTELIKRDIGAAIDLVAGGETAGIPYAAWISEELERPMLYVRKQPKGFGRNAQIEGDLDEGKRILLVEDLATDGGSKINFIYALRLGGGVVTDIFVVFYYRAFPGAEETMKKAGTNLHYLADWHDVLAAAIDGQYFTDGEIEGVRDFLDDPVAWSANNGGKAAAD